MSAHPLALAVIGRGRMGRLVTEVALERGHRVALALGSDDNPGGAGLTAAALAGIDLAIELTQPAAAPDNIERCLERGVSVVTGTTGWADPERVEYLGGLAERRGAGLLIAPNFALGVLLFRRLARRAAELLAGDELFDVRIEEAHHAGKLDAPSGTALALAGDVIERLPRKRTVRSEPGRPEPAGPEPAPGGEGPRADELVVHSTRGGSEPGLHRIVIEGPDETIELVHRAHSRRVFALGAVRAAEWMTGRTGLVELEQLAGEEERDR